MLRVFPTGIILSLAFIVSGCSSNFPTLATTTSLGYADSGSDPFAAEIRREIQQDLDEARSSHDKEKQVHHRPKLNVHAARDLINSYRKQKGLKPIILHPKLAEAALAHSKDLAARDRISHIGVDGATPWDRVKQTGFKPRLAAENVGTGQTSVKEVLKAWKQSPSHNENLLLKDATHMGIALVYKPETQSKTFWTLVVGTPL